MGVSMLTKVSILLSDCTSKINSSQSELRADPDFERLVCVKLKERMTDQG
jgi:hypothetical protein